MLLTFKRTAARTVDTPHAARSCRERDGLSRSRLCCPAFAGDWQRNQVISTLDFTSRKSSLGKQIRLYAWICPHRRIDTGLTYFLPFYAPRRSMRDFYHKNGTPGG
ncbi:unnamed protein product [Scytosiphon promiscuus]